jgi:hypothetical protein
MDALIKEGRPHRTLHLSGLEPNAHLVSICEFMRDRVMGLDAQMQVSACGEGKARRSADVNPGRDSGASQEVL